MAHVTSRRSALAPELGVAGSSVVAGVAELEVVAGEGVVVLLPVVGLLGLIRLITSCGPPF